MCVCVCVCVCVPCYWFQRRRKRPIDELMVCSTPSVNLYMIEVCVKSAYEGYPHTYMTMYSDLYFLLLVGVYVGVCIVHEVTVSHTYFKWKEWSVCVFVQILLVCDSGGHCV